MCPVCHESMPTIRFSFSCLSRMSDIVYENDGRILKCGHELCAGWRRRSIHVKPALFISHVTDCLEDMSQSAIVHDGIFGYGDERQNILAEQAFEDAAAKGFRPCMSFPSHVLQLRRGTNMEHRSGM
jgi:hypothetical protein